MKLLRILALRGAARLLGLTLRLAAPAVLTPFAMRASSAAIWFAERRHPLPQALPRWKVEARRSVEIGAKCLILLVGGDGLEPPTLSV
jgi:hypothetical protein